MNDIKVVHLAIGSLIPYEKNARIHTDKQIDLLAKGIKKYGFINPIVVDDKNVIIAGHGRLLALKKLGYVDLVPCIKKEGLTEKQIKELRLSDNQLHDLSSNDRDLVIEEFERLGLENYEIELLGFDENYAVEIDIDEFFEDSNSDNVKKEKLIICPSCDFKIKI